MTYYSLLAISRMTGVPYQTLTYHAGRNRFPFTVVTTRKVYTRDQVSWIADYFKVGDPFAVKEVAK